MARVSRPCNCQQNSYMTLMYNDVHVYPCACTVHLVQCLLLFSLFTVGTDMYTVHCVVVVTCLCKFNSTQ